jgi:LmbE family N-acetylglucosaminyl deacetylase
MHVLTTAKTLGLEADGRGELSGTIEEGIVLAALEELASAHPDHADLFILASDRVRSSRSAGLEVLDQDSVFSRYRDSNEIQLRYRGEIKEVFDDLVIDLALRGADMTRSEDDTTGVTSSG